MHVHADTLLSMSFFLVPSQFGHDHTLTLFTLHSRVPSFLINTNTSSTLPLSSRLTPHTLHCYLLRTYIPTSVSFSSSVAITSPPLSLHFIPSLPTRLIHNVRLCFTSADRHSSSRSEPAAHRKQFQQCIQQFSITGRVCPEARPSSGYFLVRLPNSNHSCSALSREHFVAFSKFTQFRREPSHSLHGRVHVSHLSHYKQLSRPSQAISSLLLQHTYQFSGISSTHAFTLPTYTQDIPSRHFFAHFTCCCRLSP